MSNDVVFKPPSRIAMPLNFTTPIIIKNLFNRTNLNKKLAFINKLKEPEPTESKMRSA